MMKKVIALLLAGALILSMAACDKKDEPEETKETLTSEAETTEKETTAETEEETTVTEEETTVTEEETTATEEETTETEEETTETEEETSEPEGEPQIVGGWTLNDSFPATEMTEEETDRFAKAMEGFAGVGYEPIACLGQQVVAGANYAYLCSGTAVVPGAVPALYIVKVYEDLEGTVSVLDSEKVEVEDILELFEEEAEDGEEASEEDDMPDGGVGMLAGGWQVNETLGGVILPEGALEAFSEATKDLAGASYNAIALVGSQLVAGSNYLIIAEEMMVTNPPKQSICVMKIYSPIDGSAPTITDVKDWEYWD